MCGFAGLVGREQARTDLLENTVSRMNACIRHRGPDSEATWVDPSNRAAFAFSRLAIQDLSPLADQPMHSESGRYTILYNGEIYNTDELRLLIARGPETFRTHCDTEVLLACIEKLGLETTLRRANGMFAIALWDKERRVLSLARDRLGKKPLHYSPDASRFLFASEIKAILRVDSGDRQLSAAAVDAYFALTYIPAPLSIFKGIHKVRPGHILEINENLAMTESAYWSLGHLADSKSPRSVAYTEAVEECSALIDDASRRRLVSDVPIGVLLSGGVDSSLIAHTIAQRLGVPLKTFTIGLEDETLDELPAARALAAKIGVENISLLLSKQGAFELIDQVMNYLDEPFGDFSALPTYAVCHLARNEATVLLSGDGGDEVFGGYTRYPWAVGLKSIAAWGYAAYRSGTLRVGRRELAIEIYRRLMSLGSADGSMPAAELQKLLGSDGVAASALQYLRYIDMSLYLPDDILVKTDRMSMANSIELRSPLLDYRLVEFSWRLPDSALVYRGQRKRILRELFIQRFGASSLQGKKQGFTLPVADWLVGPLRDQLETAITTLKQRAELAPYMPRLEGYWKGLLAGDRSLGHQVWTIYAFWRWLILWERRTSWE